MAYDPQSQQRRPISDENDPTPIDSFLGSEPSALSGHDQVATLGVALANDHDPPPVPAVTPAPADPPSDRLLASSGLAGAAGVVLALMVLRHLWRRRSKPKDSP